MPIQEKYKFTVEITVDRDLITGWGHQSEDWYQVMFGNLLHNRHYNPEVNLRKLELISNKGDVVLSQTASDSSTLTCDVFDSKVAENENDRMRRMLEEAGSGVIKPIF